MRFDHLAWPSFDPEATHRFWTGFLPFRLAAAFDGESAEWGGVRFLACVYASGSGAVVDFFHVAGTQRPAADGLPQDIRHLALLLPPGDTVRAWERRAARAGIEHWVETHGERASLYLIDPNGHCIELTDEATAPEPRADPEATEAVLARWMQ